MKKSIDEKDEILYTSAMSKLLISQYHNEVDKIIQFGGSRKETAVRNAFFNLLNQYCEPKHSLLIPELDYKTRFDIVAYPDGTVKDALRRVCTVSVRTMEIIQAMEQTPEGRNTP